MQTEIPGRALLAAVANFRVSYAAMLLSFDEAAVLDSLGSWLRTEGYAMVSPNDSEDDLQTTLEIGFAFLVGRGAIVPTRPFSVAGQRQYHALRTVSGGKATEQSAAPSDPLTELIADNANLPASAFKMKWMVDPARRAIYEQAIAAGRV